MRLSNEQLDEIVRADGPHATPRVIRACVWCAQTLVVAAFLAATMWLALSV